MPGPARAAPFSAPGRPAAAPPRRSPWRSVGLEVAAAPVIWSSLHLLQPLSHHSNTPFQLTILPIKLTHANYCAFSVSSNVK